METSEPPETTEQPRHACTCHESHHARSRARRFALPALTLIAILLIPVAAFAGGRFNDVSAGGTHAQSIGWVADAGITLGCNPAGTIFCPRDPVSREQMATFMKRLAEAGVVEPARLWAVVDTNGNLIEGRGVTEINRVQTGEVRVRFDRTVTSSCSYNATIGTRSTAVAARGFIGVGLVGGTVAVDTWDTSGGTRANRPFHLQVFCSPEE